MNVELTRKEELPTRDFGGVTLVSIRNPSVGATEVIVLRGIVPRGAEFPTQSHDRDEVITFLTGGAAYTIDSESGMMSTGDMVVIPARAIHAFEALEDIDAIAVLPGGARTFAPDGTEIPQRV